MDLHGSLTLQSAQAAFKSRTREREGGFKENIYFHVLMHLYVHWEIHLIIVSDHHIYHYRGINGRDLIYGSVSVAI